MHKQTRNWIHLLHLLCFCIWIRRRISSQTHMTQKTSQVGKDKKSSISYEWAYDQGCFCVHSKKQLPFPDNHDLVCIGVTNAATKCGKNQRSLEWESILAHMLNVYANKTKPLRAQMVKWIVRGNVWRLASGTPSGSPMGDGYVTKCTCLLFGASYTNSRCSHRHTDI